MRSVVRRALCRWSPRYVEPDPDVDNVRPHDVSRQLIGGVGADGAEIGEGGQSPYGRIGSPEEHMFLNMSQWLAEGYLSLSDVVG